jgi:biopolymer transport protein TolR
MAMESRRRRARPMSQINVVPYIDVMLVLLVIFMVTAPMINPGQVELPRVDRSAAPPVQPIEITVRESGQLSMHDRSRTGSARVVSMPELVQELKERQKQAPEQPVVIAGDTRVPYGKVMEVLDALQREQVARVGLLTRPKQ